MKYNNYVTVKKKLLSRTIWAQRPFPIRSLCTFTLYDRTDGWNDLRILKNITNKIVWNSNEACMPC